MIVIYKRSSEKVIRAEAKRAVRQIKKWFKDNPKKDICRANIWYGRVAAIGRDSVQEDMDKAVKKALK